MENKIIMKLYKQIVLLAFFVLLSCDKLAVYQKMDAEFEHNRWFKNDSKIHSINIEEESSFTLFFDFSHVYNFQFSEIPIQFKIEYPDGTLSVEKIKLAIKDENGKDKGECMGDVCDLRQAVFTDKILKKGNYTISVSHQFNGEYLPNVIGVGLRMERTKI